MDLGDGPRWANGKAAVHCEVSSEDSKGEESHGYLWQPPIEDSTADG